MPIENMTPEERNAYLEEARRVQEEFRIPPRQTPEPPSHPPGFIPGINTAEGKAVVRLDDQVDLPVEEYDDFFTEVLKTMGINTAHFEIDAQRGVEIRTWMAHYGVDQEPRWFWYYKFKINRVARSAKANLDESFKRLLTPPKKNQRPRDEGEGQEYAFVVLNSDWQVGKADGEGTPFTMRAVELTTPRIKQRYENLRKAGYKINDLVILNLGDLVEGCDGHYDQQTYSVQLSQRQQRRVARALLTHQIRAWAPDFNRVEVAAVAGNHGENRNEFGKSYTDFGDNEDLALVEDVAEAFQHIPEWNHVSWRIPETELVYALDIHGTTVAVTHGHVANTRTKTGKGLSHTKVWDWWYGQNFGRQSPANADMLISGHFHYLSVIQQAGRTAIQAPALDGGSQWYVNKEGLHSNPGVATLLIGGGVEDGKKPGWAELQVISPYKES